MCVLRIFQTIRFDTLGCGAKSNRMNLEERHYNAVLRRSVVFFHAMLYTWISLLPLLCIRVCVCVRVLRIMYLVRNWYIFAAFFGFSIVIYRTDNDDDDYDSTNDEGRIIFSDILRVCFRSIISTAL